jgi:hypothetical protein
MMLSAVLSATEVKISAWATLEPRKFGAGDHKFGVFAVRRINHKKDG